MFANKIWLPTDPVVLDCAHEIIFNKTYLTGDDHGEQFENVQKSMPWMEKTNFSIYETLSAVKYQRWKKTNQSIDFDCAYCYEKCQH